MKFYMYSVTARVESAGLVTISSSCGICTRENEEQAIGNALNQCKEKFPATQGYYDHRVNMIEVPLQTIREMAKSLTD